MSYVAICIIIAFLLVLLALGVVAAVVYIRARSVEIANYDNIAFCLSTKK